MNELIRRYCPRIDFDSYEDFLQNYRCEASADFNFSFDIVDEWARLEPDKLALVWTNDEGDMRR